MSAITAGHVTTAPITGIDIHTYLVHDPARAIAFWHDVMGLRLTLIYEDRGGEFELPDGSMFGLWKMEDDSWQRGDGIMFAVPDIHAAVDYYRAKGVAIAHLEEFPLCWMAFAEDSEGNGFILHQRKAR